jgi:hypothetical protein
MARGVLQLLAIEYGIVVASRDAETTTTLAFCTRFLASFTQPFVFLCHPFLVSRNMAMREPTEQWVDVAWNGQTRAIFLRERMEWTIVSPL